MRYCKTILRALLLTFLISIIIPNKPGFTAEDYWQEKKSDHFAVYYKAMKDAALVDELLKSCEDYYQNITENLGFRRFNFWSWENRCKIYVFPSPEEYHQNSDQPTWSRAHANIRERTIKTFTLQKDFTQTILPHEMGHLIFREFIGYKTRLPLWLDEGIACLQEVKNRDRYILMANAFVKSKLFIPLDKLTEINKDALAMPSIFYAEAASLVRFLFEKYGQEKFVDYCRKLRDNKNWKKSLLQVYELKSITQLNDQWIEFLLNLDTRLYKPR
ncbi:MAG: hypothetical protein JW734_04420 [Candidatus Omnitrophica bacterium]|nr:hypothetical protein [Candidatus Omnitrophota bacterium]